MSITASSVKKLGATLGLQMMLALLAFSLLALSSYVFVNGVERERMAEHVIGKIDLAQARIESDLEQAESMVAGLALTVYSMIQNGDSLPTIETYFQEITAYAQKVNIPGFIRFFAYLDAFDGALFDGSGIRLDTVKVEECPWYVAAVEADGKTAFTNVYANLITKENIISCVRRILDGDGKPLGIVGMNISLEELNETIAELKPFEGSYGILSDNSASIIAHHNRTMIGKRLSDVTSNADDLEADLREDGILLQRSTISHAGVPYVVYYKALEKYNWGIGAITPRNAYVVHTYNIIWFFITLNALVLAAFCYLLMHLSKVKHRGDEFTQIMFSGMPLACFMWTNERKVGMCNKEALTLFGVRDKEQLREYFDSKLSPEYQPGGDKSSELSLTHIEKAFDSGYDRFEWMHRSISGEPLPVEVTLIRAQHSGKPVLLSYIRDTREEKASLEKIREADERAKLLLDTMPMCANFWNSDLVNIDCNLEAVRMFELKDKQEYLDKFFDLSPETQPDGCASTEKAREYVKKAFDEGYCRFEWMHKSRDGEPIPCEVTLVRVNHKDAYMVAGYTRDMREMNAVMTKLRESEERLMMMLDTTPLGITIWDKDINLIDFNFEAARVVGIYSKKEYMERFPETTPQFQPDGTPSAEKLKQVIGGAFETGSCNMIWHHYHINGETIPFDAVGFRVNHKGEDIVILYCRDMREHNAMMAKLREADERAMAMLDASPFGTTMWDRNLNLLDYNYEAARVVGIFNKEDYREKFGSLVPEFQPDGRKSIDVMAKYISMALEEGIMSRSPWFQNTIEGELVEFEATIVRIKYKNDYAAIIYCRDMREVNIALAKMREADERAQLLLDSTPVSCTLFDDKLNVIDCNQEAVKLVGAADKREYMENFLKFSPEHQPDGTPTIRKSPYIALKALETGHHSLEWTHRHANGDLIPCELTLVRLKHRGKDIVAGYARDLREVKEMVKNMHRAEIAEKSNRAKSKFLAAMSHEIRTPMNVILGVAEMQMQDETLAPHQREALMQIYNSSDLLLGIINDILDLSKIEADKMEFSPAKYELASLISDTASLNVMRSSKPTEFELDIDENAPAYLYGDELRIKQILNNILSNAFKFTDEGKISLKVEVTDEPDNNETGDNNVILCMTVADSGQGMSQEQVSRLFSEYTRFNLDTNRTVEGTGLGMNITHRLINMMGGKIVVDSELGKGTTVNIRLPQKRVGEKRIGKELADNLRKFRVDSSANLKRTQFKRDYMPYGRVLIVDDVESNLYVAKGLMAPYGLTIEVASGGLEAIAKIKNGNVYDAIFMDHMMPKVDGIEAARRIRGLGYTAPIVALTANAVVGQADIFLQNGFDDFISKPIDIRQLNSILNRLVRDKQPPEVIEKAAREKELAAKSAAIASQNSAPNPELLAVFARDASRVMPIFEQTAQDVANLSGDAMRLFTTSAHGMKSALANIGESRLSQLAFTLEKAGKTNDRKTIAAQLPNFIKALRGTAAKAEVESKTKDSAAHDEDPQFFKEQMALIAKACGEYDAEATTVSIEALKKKAWTHETEDIINRIEEQLLHSNFDEAGDLAGRFA